MYPGQDYQDEWRPPGPYPGPSQPGPFFQGYMPGPHFPPQYQHHPHPMNPPPFVYPYYGPQSGPGRQGEEASLSQRGSDRTRERSPGCRDRTRDRSPGRRDRLRERSPVRRDRTRERSPGRRGLPRERSPGRRDMTRERSPGYGYRARERSPGRGYRARERSPGRGYRARDRSPGSGYRTRARSPGRRDMLHERSPGRGCRTRDRSPGRGDVARDKSSGRGDWIREKSPGCEYEARERSPGQGGKTTGNSTEDGDSGRRSAERAEDRPRGREVEQQRPPYCQSSESCPPSGRAPAGSGDSPSGTPKEQRGAEAPPPSEPDDCRRSPARSPARHDRKQDSDDSRNQQSDARRCGTRSARDDRCSDRRPQESRQDGALRCSDPGGDGRSREDRRGGRPSHEGGAPGGPTDRQRADDRRPARGGDELDRRRDERRRRRRDGDGDGSRTRRGDGAAGQRRARPTSHAEQTDSRSATPQLASEEVTSERDRRFEEEERQLREKREMIHQALDDEKLIWTRSSPADPFYQRHPDNPNLMVATERTRAQCATFQEQLAERGDRVRAALPPFCPGPVSAKRHVHNCGGSGSDDTSSDSSESEDETVLLNEELERKSRHPYRLHPELWYNDHGKMNVGDVCRCSIKSRQAGIRHNIYAGEQPVPRCDPWTNNADRLFHYRILICPPTNFLVSTPTSIYHDGHEFIFEGLSLLSHYPLTELPPCHIIRFNIEYTVLYLEERLPDNFVLQEVDAFKSYLYDSLLEMADLDMFPHADAEKKGCPMFHLFPRFVRDLADNGKEILSLNEVLAYMLNSDQPLVSEDELEQVSRTPLWQWQNRADQVRGMLVTHPGRKPCCIRLDQLDREVVCDGQKVASDAPHFPEIVHFGIRPPQLSYAGNPEYQKAWREYVKYRHLLANLPKPSMEDKRRLAAREAQLQNLRLQAKLKRDVTVAVSSAGFRRTGIMADVVQHALFLPVLVCHLRFHKSLDVLEETIDYRFKNRALLQLALTHPSYRENHGTNPDHSRNSLSNCGIRQPEYGDRCINYSASRKRGLNILINIMSQFGKKEATESRITHNERLEFLGDAVVEFLTSIHLFFMFPNLEEGGLATYRAAIVQNQHLAVLARQLRLHEYLLYAHGSDLCHDLELRHAMANCFEALMGALFLDAGIEVADKVFSRTLYMDDERLLAIWQHYPPHPLQEQEPKGDRKWIDKFPRLQQMQEFEKLVGVEFMHIRLLARSFTDRSIGFNNLTLGSNQRLEFLGDTVLQLIASEYLYRHFPEHHEGHLSLLRSSLVNNRTQAVVCADLGMTKFAAYSHLKTEIKMKDKADLLEAFIGALYVDKGLQYCRRFCQVCFFPRLQLFILNQDWNDPKSKLQQCCLTLRNMDGSEPDIPVYKVIECMGPTNTRVYSVAVYFQGKRLAKASGHSIQMAEMNAATQALANCKHLFPQLDHQHRVIAKSVRIQTKRLEGQARE